MSFALDKIIPWGRSFEEYTSMFRLEPVDLAKKIVGCADGPASFNAGMHARGHSVCSVDPVYSLDAVQIRARIEETYPIVMEQLRRNPDDYVWTRVPSPEALGELRRRSMDVFLSDYPHGKDKGRYVPGGLEQLPFEESAFDLALCSHFLFLYSGPLSRLFHLRAVDEMLRVAGEVRIFPLLTLAAQTSPYLKDVCEHVSALGRDFEITGVDYEFQRGGNRMLRIW